MQHIKLFEEQEKNIWIVFYQKLESPTEYFIKLFDDKISAENYFIDVCNQLAKSENYYKKYKMKKSYDDLEDVIFTVEDADLWLDDNYEYLVSYMSIQSMGKYDLPENLKIGRETKKYSV